MGLVSDGHNVPRGELRLRFYMLSNIFRQCIRFCFLFFRKRFIPVFLVRSIFQRHPAEHFPDSSPAYKPPE